MGRKSSLLVEGDRLPGNALLEVASLLGAAVGASGAVDAGWSGAGRLIGQAGGIVRPRLYALRHLRRYQHGGVQGRVIVAVNKIPKPPSSI